MTDQLTDHPTDEIEPLVPVMSQSNVRSDGGIVSSTQTELEILPAEERYAIDPLVPDLS